jgi:hypothetical protein
MPLPYLGTNTLAELLANRIDSAPIVFICHSLGGLVVKQLLRIASDAPPDRGNRLFRQTRGLMLLGTPNSGASLASWAERLSAIVRPSAATRSLAAHDPQLQELNLWYLDHAPKEGIRTEVYFETKPLRGAGVIVDAASADPGISGVRPVPLPEDHATLVKPTTRAETLFLSAVRFIGSCIQTTVERSDLAGFHVEAARADQPVYDVFISHSHAQRAWVEALAFNLQGAGRSVFLDIWRLVPGRDWVEALRRSLASSRAAILVVSPEAMRSGWVRTEFEILKSRQVDNPDFRIIPVIHSAVEGDMPFAGSIQWIDFRSPVDARFAFGRLLAGLDGREPGPSPVYISDQWFAFPAAVAARPDAAEQQIIERSLEPLFNAKAVVLFAQERPDSSTAHLEIVRRAKIRFGDDGVIRFVPSYVAPEDGVVPFFESLSIQAGFPGENASPQSFQRHFSKRLDGARRLCAIFTKFEHSTPAALDLLCGILRALNERHDNLRVVILGGERLSELRYGRGALSYLNHATAMDWPDPDNDEIRQELRLSDMDVSGELFDAALSASGRHLGILVDLVRTADGSESTPDSLAAQVIECPTLWAAVNPMREDDAVRARLVVLLEREDLGRADPYIQDPILRRLYWLNLITRRRSPRGNRLVWRSKPVREAIREIVAGI